MNIVIPCEECLTLAICRQRTTVTCPIIFKSYNESEHSGGSYYLDRVAECLGKFYWYWLDSDEIMIQARED